MIFIAIPFCESWAAQKEHRPHLAAMAEGGGAPLCTIRLGSRVAAVKVC
jgi:hypothetical protein